MYRRTSDRSPWLVSVGLQVALTSGLYPGPGLYTGPGFISNYVQSKSLIFAADAFIRS